MARNKYPEETVNLILDTAQSLFLEKGYEHTTVQDIIDNLGGLTKGAIYHHFKSKEEILSAVTERLFSNNTLHEKWKKIIDDEQLNGSEKLKKMLKEAIADEQEQKFRSMGINLGKMSQMLCDLLLRSVNEIAPKAFLPVLEQGKKDGSLKIENPKELAEVLALVANVWLNPIVFTSSEAVLMRKLQTVTAMLAPFGIDVSDIYPEVIEMNNKIQK